MPVTRLLFLCAACAALSFGQTTLTSTLNITSADNGKTFNNYRISTTSGPCIKMTGVSNVTISNSNIGPCGVNNSDADSNGIEINGGTGNKIYDSYIHVENRALTNSFSPSNSHAGIQGNGTANVTIQGNVVCYGSTDVRAVRTNGVPSTGWVVDGNYLCNPRGYDGSGEFFQAVDSYNMTVSNNYAFACIIGGTGTAVICPTSPVYLFTENKEDGINFYFSSPVSGVSETVSGNYVAGGHSPSGNGIEIDQYASNVTVQNNTVTNGGLAGISFSDGSNNVMTGNRVWMSNPYSINQTGVRVNVDYAGHPCGGDVVSNNIVREVGASNGGDFWYPVPACISTNSGNVYGTPAETALGLSGLATWAMIKTALVPPLIPPVPKNCTVNSPYSTQISLPRCGAVALPTISAFTASPTSILFGGSSTLSWATSGASILSISPGIGTVAGVSISVHPTSTTTYTLSATNNSGTATTPVTVAVLPTISSFSADPSTFSSGSASTLAWSTNAATALSISPGVGTVTGLSSVVVHPTVTTVYVLTASNASGSNTANTTATVAVPGTPNRAVLILQ